MLESSQRLLEILHAYPCDFQIMFVIHRQKGPCYYSWLLLVVFLSYTLRKSLFLSFPQPLQVKTFNLLICRILLPRPHLPWACTESLIFAPVCTGKPKSENSVPDVALKMLIERNSSFLWHACQPSPVTPDRRSRPCIRWKLVPLWEEKVNVHGFLLLRSFFWLADAQSRYKFTTAFLQTTRWCQRPSDLGVFLWARPPCPPTVPAHSPCSAAGAPRSGAVESGSPELLPTEGLWAVLGSLVKQTTDEWKQNQEGSFL